MTQMTNPFHVHFDLQMNSFLGKLASYGMIHTAKAAFVLLQRIVRFFLGNSAHTPALGSSPEGFKLINYES